MKRKVVAKSAAPEVVLPSGIRPKDLECPSWKSKDRVVEQFPMWLVPSFGWCIPTLLIRGIGRRANPYMVTPRTYATTLDGKTVRIGLGPHVQKIVTVYVRESRLKDLQKFLDLRTQGAAASNEIRDRISTRRAQGALRRNSSGWGGW